MNFHIFSGLITAVKNWKYKQILRSEFKEAYRVLCFDEAWGELEGEFDDALNVLQKHYEKRGLSIKDSSSVVGSIKSIRIE